MSPFLTDEVSPELSPSSSQGKTYSPKNRSSDSFPVNSGKSFSVGEECPSLDVKREECKKSKTVKQVVVVFLLQTVICKQKVHFKNPEE